MSDCCPRQGTEIAYDYVNLSSARSFLERIGAIPAYRLPMPRIDPWRWKMHRVPKHAPLPLAEYQQALQGEPMPDAGQTYAWPHPEFTQLTEEQQRTEIL